MKLFFETAGQAQRFLSMVPLGLVLALCLDADAWAGRLRLAADCVFMLTAGLAILCFVAAFRENSLRAYHLLGLLVGTILYSQGIGRLIRMAKRRMCTVRQEKA